MEPVGGAGMAVGACVFELGEAVDLTDGVGAEEGELAGNH